MPAVPITHIGQRGQGAQEAEGDESQHEQLTVFAQHLGILVHQGSDHGFQAPELQTPPRRTQSEAEAEPWGLLGRGCSVHFRAILPLGKLVDRFKLSRQITWKTNWDVFPQSLPWKYFHLCPLFFFKTKDQSKVHKEAAFTQHVTWSLTHLQGSSREGLPSSQCKMKLALPCCPVPA